MLIWTRWELEEAIKTGFERYTMYKPVISVMNLCDSLEFKSHSHRAAFFENLGLRYFAD